MDEDIAIINVKTRNEKIKNFLVANKKPLILTLLPIIFLVIGFYSYQIYKDDHKEWLSDKYNSAVIEFNNDDKIKVISVMKEIINDKDSTYSPLALYFLIDNNLISNKSEINELFDILIEKTTLENEIKNLIIYKKGLYNADFVSENELLNILKPITNSKSVWKSHALYLLAEYFYSKNEIEKSKDFFNQLLLTENANQDLVKNTKKRLNRDLSE